MKVKYGTTEFEIHPAFAPSVDFDAAGGDDQGSIVKETWDIEGSFSQEGWSNLITSWNNMVAVLRAPAQNFLILTDADETVYQLLAGSCTSGPTCKNVQVVEKRQGFLVSNIRFRLTIEAEYINPFTPTGHSGKRNVKFSFDYDSLGFLRMTETGEFVSKSTIDRPPNPTLVPDKASFILDSKFELSNNKRECTYTYTFTERKTTLPDGDIKELVGDFSLDISESSAEDFLHNEVRVSGSCKLRRKASNEEPWRKTGLLVNNPVSLQRSKAASFIPVKSVEDISDVNIRKVIKWIENSLIGGSAKIIDKEISVNVFDLEIAFNYRLFKGSDLVGFTYSISFVPSVVRMSEVNVFGFKPVIQKLGYTSMEISESGEITWYASRPQKPSPFWPDKCTSARIDYPKLSYGKDGYPISGAISFSFAYRDENFRSSDLIALAAKRTSEYRLPSLGIFE